MKTGGIANHSNPCTATLADLVQLQRGYDLTSEERRPGTVDVIGGGGPNGTHDKANVRGPGVVVVRSGSGFGNVWWVRNDFWAHNTVLYVKSFNGNDEKFTYYALTHADFSSYNSGGAQPSLNRNFIADIPIFIPPLPEQRRIAAVLDAWDTAIATAERLVVARENLRAKLLRDLYATCIEPTDTRSSWTACAISELAEVAGGGTPPTGTAAFWGGDIKWCTPTDVTALANRWIEATARTITGAGLAASSATLIPVRSVILCSRASVGECAINLAPMATNQGFQSLIPHNKRDAEFLLYLVKAIKKRLIRIAAGSTFLEFGRNELRKLVIQAPDAVERQRIGGVMSLVDDGIDQERGRLASLRHQKRGLMQQLLTGKLRVPESIDRLMPGAGGGV